MNHTPPYVVQVRRRGAWRGGLTTALLIGAALLGLLVVLALASGLSHLAAPDWRVVVDGQDISGEVQHALSGGTPLLVAGVVMLLAAWLLVALPLLLLAGLGGLVLVALVLALGLLGLPLLAVLLVLLLLVSPLLLVVWGLRRLLGGQAR